MRNVTVAIVSDERYRLVVRLCGSGSLLITKVVAISECDQSSTQSTLSLLVSPCAIGWQQYLVNFIRMT